AIKCLAETPHPFGHRQVADAHLAQVVVKILAERVEQLLSEAAVGTSLTISPRPGVSLPVEAAQEEHEMEYDQVKTALDGVRHAVARVKGRGARLRHDHAIERANDAGVRIAPKWGEYHRVSPDPRRRRQGAVKRRIVISWLRA